MGEKMPPTLIGKPQKREQNSLFPEENTPLEERKGVKIDPLGPFG
jgi:hypothetical protein